MVTLYKHNIKIATLNSVQSAYKYIGLNKTIEQALQAGFSIQYKKLIQA